MKSRLDVARFPPSFFPVFYCGSSFWIVHAPPFLFLGTAVSRDVSPCGRFFSPMRDHALDLEQDGLILASPPPRTTFFRWHAGVVSYPRNVCAPCLPPPLFWPSRFSFHFALLCIRRHGEHFPFPPPPLPFGQVRNSSSGAANRRFSVLRFFLDPLSLASPLSS